MLKPICLPIATLLLSLAFTARSQELRPALKKLTPDQKLEILEYMRAKGSSIDQEIEQMYNQLPKSEQQKTGMFVELLGNSDSKPNRTEVSWNRDTIKFNKVEEGTIVLDSFIVRNNGSYPYLISRVQTSCDCTVLHYPKFPVMPGEQATIRVEFDSTNKIGKARGGIVLYDNSAPNLRTVLYMDGVITPRKGGKNPWD